MQQETPDKLARLERDGLVAVGAIDAIILVGERDALGVGLDQPAIGDGHAVGVAGEVSKYLLGPGEWALGIDVPVGVVERLQPGLEAIFAREIGVRTEELHAAVGVRRL